jgi:molybdate/tungstate transport system substrate-binding protein
LKRTLCCAALIAAAAVGIRAEPASRLTVCHAGSVGPALAAVERSFSERHRDVMVTDVSGGSVTLARKLATGVQPCDVYASADYLDIDRMLTPAGVADYTIAFARGRMVLAYLATDPNAEGVTASNWFEKVLAPGVRIAGAHPFLDPGGYRAHMIFELAQEHYKLPHLYNALLEHYQVIAAAVGAEAAPALGRDFSFQITYEHSAAATARRNGAYRYLRLPASIDLSDPGEAASYARAGVTMPGLGVAGAGRSITIPASAAMWGITVPRKAASRELAVEFVAMVLGPIGTAALQDNGPAPITPALVSAHDYGQIPQRLRPLVSQRPAVR